MKIINRRSSEMLGTSKSGSNMAPNIITNWKRQSVSIRMCLSTRLRRITDTTRAVLLIGLAGVKKVVNQRDRSREVNGSIIAMTSV